MNDALGWAAWVATIAAAVSAVTVLTAYRPNIGCGGGPTVFQRYSTRAFLSTIAIATALVVASYLTN